MDTRVRGTTITIIGIVILLMVVSPISPYVLAHAMGDSMEPTLPKGSLYVVDKTSEISNGDIIMFRSARENSLVTHRVVRETDTGYVTKGDNNPSPDQAAGVPPIPPSEVEGKVVSIRAYPLVIPGLGVWSQFVGQNSVFVFGLIWTILIGRAAIRSSRTRVRLPTNGDIIRPLLGISIVLCVTVIILVSGTTTVPFYASDNPPQGVTDIPLDTDVVRTVPIEVSSYESATQQFVSVEGAQFQSAQPDPENKNTLLVTIQLGPYDSTGIYQTSVSVYHYPRILPYSVVAALHNIHPLIAGTAVSIVAFFPAIILYLLLIDPEKPLYTKRPSEKVSTDHAPEK